MYPDSGENNIVKECLCSSPCQFCVLLPGVAVVVGVLVDQFGLLGALAGQVGDLGGHTTSVPLNPDK